MAKRRRLDYTDRSSQSVEYENLLIHLEYTLPTLATMMCSIKFLQFAFLTVSSISISFYSDWDRTSLFLVLHGNDILAVVVVISQKPYCILFLFVLLFLHLNVELE